MSERTLRDARLTFETRQRIREARSARSMERVAQENDIYPIGIPVECERRECSNVFIVRQGKQRFCSAKCRKYENQRHHDRDRRKKAA